MPYMWCIFLQQYRIQMDIGNSYTYSMYMIYCLCMYRCIGLDRVDADE